jgi:hypothetical protein
VSLFLVGLDHSRINGQRKHENVGGAIIIRGARKRVASTDPMPAGMRLDSDIVQSIGIRGPGVIPTAGVPCSDLWCDRLCFADLCAQWSIIDRTQKLRVVLRIIEIDFHSWLHPLIIPDTSQPVLRVGTETTARTKSVKANRGNLLDVLLAQTTICGHE